MENCPVCGQALREGVCPSCGYDLSADYVRWPTFQWIPSVERPPDPEKERPDPFRRVLSLLRRQRAPSPEQVSVLLDRDDPLLPILLTVLMGNVLLSYLARLSDVSAFFPVVGVLAGLLLYLCLHCRRRTMFLVIPAMLAGIQMGTYLSSFFFELSYDFFEILLLWPLFAFSDNHPGYPMVAPCIICALLAFRLARRGWTGWKFYACMAGCAVVSCMATDIIIDAGNRAADWYSGYIFNLNLIYLVYLLHVLMACLVLSALAADIARRPLPVGGQYVRLAGSAVIIFYCCLICHYSFNFDYDYWAESFVFEINSFLPRLFLPQACGSAACALTAGFGARRGWPEWGRYLAVIAVFLLSMWLFQPFLQPWLAQGLRDWVELLQAGRLF